MTSHFPSNVIKCPPLNWNTLGRIKSDGINQIIQFYFRLQIYIRYPKDLIHTRHFRTQYCDKKYCNKKDIFGPWISISQGKLFKKSRYVFSELTLVGHWYMWLEIIFLSQYCVQKCHVWIVIVRCQFYQRFMSIFFVRKFVQSQTLSRKILSNKKYMHVKCW